MCLNEKRRCNAFYIEHVSNNQEEGLILSTHSGLVTSNFELVESKSNLSVSAASEQFSLYCLF